MSPERREMGRETNIGRPIGKSDALEIDEARPPMELYVPGDEEDETQEVGETITQATEELRAAWAKLAGNPSK